MSLEERITSLFTQASHGQYPPREGRPNPNLSAKPSFVSKEEYMTILGFGVIGEHEHTFDAQKAVSSDVFRLRVMTIHEAGNRRYLGFLQKPEGSEARFMIGDSLTINFDEEADICEDDWHGFVIEPVPFGTINDIAIIISRPWDEEKKVFRTDVGDFTAIDSTSLKSEPDARSALMEAPAVDVSVRIKISDKDTKRQINSLCLLYKFKGKNIWDLLLGNDFRHLPSINVFRTIDASEEQVSSVLNLGTFKQKQQEACLACRSLPAGMGVFQGPPGTGKTHFLLHTALPFLFFDSTTPRRSNNPRHQVLLVASVNGPVDDMARKLRELTTTYRPDRDLIIIRTHSLTTETDIVSQPARDERGKPAHARPETFQPGSEDALLTEMLAAHLVKTVCTAATERPFGIADKRVEHFELSLGMWMLRFAGIVPDPKYSDPTAWASFVTLYGTYRRDPDMSRDGMHQLREATKALQNHVLQKADAILTTLSNCADPAIRENIKPDFIGIDEAAKATEPNVWHVLVGYDTTSIIQVGDQSQLMPVVKSYPNTRGGNCFAPQLRVSLFSRLITNGIDSVMFNEQGRMTPDIGEMVSNCFFDGKLIHAAYTHVENRPIAQAFINHCNPLYGDKRSALIFHNCHKGIVNKDSWSSSYNITNAIHGTNIIYAMLSAGFKPANITLVVPYTAQAKIYITALTRMQEKHTSWDLRPITVSTIDKAQCLEGDIVIFDLTVTDRFGFIDTGRLCVALSRARDGLHVIYNQAALHQTPKKHYRVFARVMNHAQRGGLIFTPVHPTENEFLGQSTAPFLRG